MKTSNHSLRSLFIGLLLILIGLWANAMPLEQIQQVRATADAHLKAAIELQIVLNKLDVTYGCEPVFVSARYSQLFDQAGVRYWQQQSSNRNAHPEISIASNCTSEPVKPMIAALIKSFTIESTVYQNLYQNLLKASEDPKAQPVLARLKAEEAGKIKVLKTKLNELKQTQTAGKKRAATASFVLGLILLIVGGFFFAGATFALMFALAGAGVGKILLGGLVVAALGLTGIAVGDDMKTQQSEFKAQIYTLNSEIEARYQVVSRLDQFKDELAQEEAQFSNPMP
jgi:hypothetical protein